MPMKQALHPDAATDGTPMRPLKQAMANGWRLRCPSCGTGALFSRFLKVNDHCPDCGEALHHHRADDAPPYFTILIVGHIVVSLMLLIEQLFTPPLWFHYTVWPSLTLIMSLAMLPRIKGALIGLQWARYMHGFGGGED